MAEILIKAKPNWMENIPPEEWGKHQITQEKFSRRSEPGDICVVRPDGWVWGNKECPPNFILIKVPGDYLWMQKELEQSLVADREIEYVKEMQLDKDEYDVTYGIGDLSKEDIRDRFVQIPDIVEIKKIHKKCINSKLIIDALKESKNIENIVDITPDLIAAGNIGIYGIEGDFTVVKVNGNAIRVESKMFKKRKYKISKDLVQIILNNGGITTLSNLNDTIYKREIDITDKITETIVPLIEPVVLEGI